MSIDDDYFDVANFVEDTSVEKAFDRIMEYLRDTELQNEDLRRLNRDLKTTVKTLKLITEEK